MNTCKRPRRYLLYASEDYSFPILKPVQHAAESRGDEVAWFVHRNAHANAYLQPSDRPCNSVDAVSEFNAEIKRELPTAKHNQHPSIEGSLTGHGELKRTGYDPLFTIDHTLAMLRDNLKRLARRTWCTTKLQRSLENQLAIYIHFHNTKLIPEIPPREEVLDAAQ